MPEGQDNRRLAAILAADVVGYSRMMGADESGTLAALKRHREAVFDPLVARHHGRVIKLIGDGTLVEFASVVDAVSCAIAVQKSVAADEEATVKLRIGINLGDIIVDGDDIYGDGVNIAARLEPLAEPGGICISSIVKDSVGSRIDVSFEDGGEVSLKNIEHPVRVWRWHPARSGHEAAATSATQEAGHGILPALAVLPFRNMTSDAEQEYFADGVVEDIITALSRFRSFAVIARNSSFVYKGRAVDVRQAARELGVSYILEGSVRRAGDRLRITAQFVDGVSGAHLWARNFDGKIEDVFDMQDRITESVAVEIEPNILKAELDRSRQKRPENLDAYDLYRKALRKFNAMEPEENAGAIPLLERAIALDPEYAAAVALCAHCFEHRLSMGWPPVGSDDAEKGLRLARAALAIADDDAIVLARCGIVLMQVGGEFDQALPILEHALELNPNDAEVLIIVGIGLLVAGRMHDALTILERTMRLNPNEKYGAMTGIAAVKLHRGNYEEAVTWARRALAESPNFNPAYWMLISGYAQLGRLDEAKRALATLQAQAPTINIQHLRSRHPHWPDGLIDGLRLAGMPEN